jgi:hypothetical protein
MKKNVPQGRLKDGSSKHWDQLIIRFDGEELTVGVPGVGVIAKREARRWVSVKPGWRVTSDDSEITVEFKVTH